MDSRAAATSHQNSWQIQFSPIPDSHPDSAPLSPSLCRTRRAFGTVLPALGEVEAFLLVPLCVVKHGEVVAGRDGLAVELTRVNVVDVVVVALKIHASNRFLFGAPASRQSLLTPIVLSRVTGQMPG